MDIDSHDSLVDGMKQLERAMHKVIVEPGWKGTYHQHQQRWNPYSKEGGTSAAIAGEDFVVVASDTRISQMDINILSRDVKKIHILNDNIVLGSAGFQGDVLQLKRVLETNLRKYRFEHRQDLAVDMCAQLLARILYRKRWFPFHTCAMIAGIDEFGKGAVYSYDPIGCIERLPCNSSGDGEPLLNSFLDNQVLGSTIAPGVERPKMTIERAIGLIKDGFRFIAEREISTGDSIYVVVCQKGHPAKSMVVPLRED